VVTIPSLEQLDSDADNFVTEYIERKLEDYVNIFLGMIFKLEWRNGGK